jgi:hypothetical protein
MASKTETAILALVAGLTTLSAQDSPVVPEPKRNEALPARIPAFGALQAWLNVLDGDGGPIDGETALGGGDAGENAYSLLQSPVIEWVVIATDDATREAAFDAGLVGIYDMLVADRTLGNTVSFVEFKNLQRSNLNTDGMAGSKAILITLEMTLTSNRPF